MREILFRGKDLNDKWVYGFYVGGLESAKYDEIFTPMNPLWKRNIVDSNTISQFTGLQDKSGKKIFGGDIVSYCVRNYDTSIERHIGIINYKGSRFYIVGEKEELNLDFILDELNLGVHDPFQRNSYELKVIGNIYDNPELLEEK